ncbi:hypothetical protein ACVIIV_003114 [Bradyrhizobium sp. USDA 4354]
MHQFPPVADATRNIVREYALKMHGEKGSILVIGEIGILRQDKALTALPTNTPVWRTKIIRIGVFAPYASRFGHALIITASPAKAVTDESRQPGIF